MLPLIIMAAASILSNKKKQDDERKQQYLGAMEHQAQRLGGDTSLASIYSGGRQIDQQSADYGPLLSLVGQGIGGGESDAPVAADDGTGSPGIMSHAKPWEEDVDDALASYDRRRGWR